MCKGPEGRERYVWGIAGRSGRPDHREQGRVCGVRDARMAGLELWLEPDHEGLAPEGALLESVQQGSISPVSRYKTILGCGWRMNCRGRCWRQGDQLGGSSHAFLVLSAIRLVQGREVGGSDWARQDQRTVGS